MAPSNSLAGRRLVFFKDNEAVAWCTGMQGGETHQQIRVDVIGKVHTQEIVTNAVAVQFTAAYVRIGRGSAKALGFMPSGSDQRVILDFDEFTAVVYDEQTGQEIERILGCKCESRNWSFDQGSLLVENASFQAKRILVEDEE